MVVVVILCWLSEFFVGINATTTITDLIHALFCCGDSVGIGRGCGRSQRLTIFLHMLYNTYRALHMYVHMIFSNLNYL